jgi:hypothetical protein
VRWRDGIVKDMWGVPFDEFDNVLVDPVEPEVFGEVVGTLAAEFRIRERWHLEVLAGLLPHIWQQYSQQRYTEDEKVSPAQEAERDKKDVAALKKLAKQLAKTLPLLESVSPRLGAEMAEDIDTDTNAYWDWRFAAEARLRNLATELTAIQAVANRERKARRKPDPSDPMTEAALALNAFWRGVLRRPFKSNHTAWAVKKGDYSGQDRGPPYIPQTGYRRGDSFVWRAMKQLGATVEDLRKLNKIMPDLLKDPAGPANLSPRLAQRRGKIGASTAAKTPSTAPGERPSTAE